MSFADFFLTEDFLAGVFARVLPAAGFVLFFNADFWGDNWFAFFFVGVLLAGFLFLLCLSSAYIC